MDLDEYIFYKSKEDPTFTKKKFAEMVGLKPHYFSRVLNGKQRPSTDLAYKIEKLTNGEVSGWDLITNYIEKEKKDGEKK